MVRLTMRDNEEYSGRAVLVNEEERLLSAKGFIDKDEMYKIMMHLAEKLCDYEDAEEQGLLLRLPIPLGTTVYSIDRQIWIDEKGCKECVYYDVDGSCYYEDEYPACTKVFDTKFKFGMIDDFGKTIFLTREEAEKKLEELREGN